MYLTQSERRNMFRRLIDTFFHVWQGRFKHGFGVALGDTGITRFHNGEYISVLHGPALMSNSTGHWPWYLFEAGYCTGPRGSWHIGVLGLTVGEIIVNDYDLSTGEIVGPDKKKYYWFFKGINHKDKQLEEII
jgi:arylsulfatase A-like enzyme